MNWPDDAVILARAVPFVEQWEGFRAAPYLCPAGVASIGYGSTRYADGRAVRLDDPPLTKAGAQTLLRDCLADLLTLLKRRLTRPPGVNQAAAMLSLAYNIGWGAFASSMLVRLFNEGGHAGDAFLAWDKMHRNGRAVAIAGLARRRAAEKALFETMDPAPPRKA